jgi:calcineurin-like phosphoesterase family protein|nr:MAG TPA: metallophosphatase domain protein [Caudoviricetes sp.]
MIKYTKEEAKHIWITSDTHFNHANIIKYCNRPFSSVEEMNETIIANWNKVVSEGDTVYHLGDFALGDKSLIPNILRSLNGCIKVIMGNHDNLDLMLKLGNEDRLITDLFWEEVIKVEKKTIILNHFPFGSLPDPATNRPIIQLHGHVHSTPNKPWDYFDNQYDVGVDNNNYTPVNLAELLDKIHYKVYIK